MMGDFLGIKRGTFLEDDFSEICHGFDHFFGNSNERFATKPDKIFF